MRKKNKPTSVKPKVKPRFMQTWKNDGSKVSKQVGGISSRGNVTWLDESGKVMLPHLHLYWSFMPNSGLEWLALKIEKWCDDERALACKAGESFKFKTRFEQKPTDSDWYSKQEWQLKRYYLGLDVKPHYVFRMDEWILGVRE